MIFDQPQTTGGVNMGKLTLKTKNKQRFQNDVETCNPNMADIYVQLISKKRTQKTNLADLLDRKRNR